MRICANSKYGCLFLFKRLLITGWIEGKLGNMDAKWSTHQFNLVSDFLSQIKAPAEIRSLRPIRDLKCVKKWKSIEFRNFALYTGIVVLKNNLKNYIYNHFVLYYCFLAIFSSELLLKYLQETAEFCLTNFIERFKQIYGKDYFTSNVHNLVHLSDDVRRFGVLNTFNTYPFESKLYYIRRLLRTGNLPLSQVANRISEIDCFSAQNDGHDSSNPTITDAPVFKKKAGFKYDELIQITKSDFNTFLYVKYPSFTIDSTRVEDRWILTKSEEIVEVSYILSCENGQVYFCGHSLLNVRNFFEAPFPSKHMLLFASQNLEKGPISIYYAGNIMCKLFMIERKKEFIFYGDDDEDDDLNVIEFVFVPLLNTIQ